MATQNVFVNFSDSPQKLAEEDTQKQGPLQADLSCRDMPASCGRLVASYRRCTDVRFCHLEAPYSSSG